MRARTPLTNTFKSIKPVVTTTSRRQQQFASQARAATHTLVVVIVVLIVAGAAAAAATPLALVARSLTVMLCDGSSGSDDGGIRHQAPGPGIITACRSLGF